MKTLKVALLGCGSVGSQVARILTEDADALAERVGARLELAGIAVRNPDAPREVELDPALFTTDADALVSDADLVIELMGGIEPARSLMLSAIGHGASVITGNKALLAEDGPTLYEKADAAGVQLSFEAAVAGAIPILRPIRDSLSGDRITRVLGIVNGTTNYILDQMDTTGAQFDDALADAKALGYAEADPTADVEGHDAAAKGAILASLAFHTRFPRSEVHCEGITSVTAADIGAAREAGYVIKLLAICELQDDDGGGGVTVRVHPTLLPREHPLAAVHGAFNAVFVEAESAGELMFYGQGAGGTPTASAVLGDLVTAAKRIVLGGPGRTESASAQLPVRGIGTAETSYYIGLDVADESGVLAKIAQVFADHGVSIETMRQTTHLDLVRPAERAADEDPEATPPSSAELRIVTHRGAEEALARTVEAVKKLEPVNSVTSVLRVEGV